VGEQTFPLPSLGFLRPPPLSTPPPPPPFPPPPPPPPPPPTPPRENPPPPLSLRDFYGPVLFPPFSLKYRNKSFRCGIFFLLPPSPFPFPKTCDRNPSSVLLLWRRDLFHQVVGTSIWVPLVNRDPVLLPVLRSAFPSPECGRPPLLPSVKESSSFYRKEGEKAFSFFFLHSSTPPSPCTVIGGASLLIASIQTFLLPPNRVLPTSNRRPPTARGSLRLSFFFSPSP